MNIPKITNKTFYITAIGVVIGAVITAGIYEFFNVYTLRSPFQNPIIRRELSPIPIKVVLIISPTVNEVTPEAKIKSKAEIVASSKYPEFIDHIWERESGRGTAKIGLNTYCTDRGMSNEFGFAVSVRHCFTDFEASVQRLEKWYEDNSGLTDNQKLCRYNSGIASDVCPYLSYNFQDMN